MLKKAKQLTDNRIVVTGDDLKKIESLAYDSSKDDHFLENKTRKFNKSEALKNKIKQIDESNRNQKQ